jgi:adenylate kinase family enzyme
MTSSRPRHAQPLVAMGGQIQSLIQALRKIPDPSNFQNFPLSSSAEKSRKEANSLHLSNRSSIEHQGDKFVSSVHNRSNITAMPISRTLKRRRRGVSAHNLPAPNTSATLARSALPSRSVIMSGEYMKFRLISLNKSTRRFEIPLKRNVYVQEGWTLSDFLCAAGSMINVPSNTRGSSNGSIINDADRCTIETMSDLNSISCGGTISCNFPGGWSARFINDSDTLPSFLQLIDSTNPSANTKTIKVPHNMSWRGFYDSAIDALGLNKNAPDLIFIADDRKLTKVADLVDLVGGTKIYVNYKRTAREGVNSVHELDASLGSQGKQRYHRSRPTPPPRTKRRSVTNGSNNRGRILKRKQTSSDKHTGNKQIVMHQDEEESIASSRMSLLDDSSTSFLGQSELDCSNSTVLTTTLRVNDSTVNSTYHKKTSGFDSAWKHLWISFVLGPPGAQTEALCKKLADERGYVHVSMVDAMRKEISSGSATSKLLLETFTKAGSEIPHTVLLEIMRNEIKTAAAKHMSSLDRPTKGLTSLEVFLAQEARKTDRECAPDIRLLKLRYLITGFPSTRSQAEHFAHTICLPQCVYHIDLPKADAIKIFTMTQSLYDLQGNIIEDNIGGAASYRRKLEAQNRVNEYYRDIEKVLNFYRSQNLVVRIDGTTVGKRNYGNFVDPEIYVQITRTLTPQPVPQDNKSALLKRKGDDSSSACLKKKAESIQVLDTMRKNAFPSKIAKVDETRLSETASGLATLSTQKRLKKSKIPRGLNAGGRGITITPIQERQSAMFRSESDEFLLEWLQGLKLPITYDVSKSTKTWRRALSNGFVFSQILALYFPKDFLAHAFSTGTSLQNKRDNWRQLCRFFEKKLRHHLSETSIGRVIAGYRNAARDMLLEVYDCLEKRKMVKARPKESLQTAEERTFTLPHNIPGSDPGVLKCGLDKLKVVFANPHVNMSFERLQSSATDAIMLQQIVARGGGSLTNNEASQVFHYFRSPPPPPPPPLLAIPPMTEQQRQHVETLFANSAMVHHQQQMPPRPDEGHNSRDYGIDVSFGQEDGRGQYVMGSVPNSSEDQNSSFNPPQPIDFAPQEPNQEPAIIGEDDMYDSVGELSESFLKPLSFDQ